MPLPNLRVELGLFIFFFHFVNLSFLFHLRRLKFQGGWLIYFSMYGIHHLEDLLKFLLCLNMELKFSLYPGVDARERPSQNGFLVPTVGFFVSVFFVSVFFIFHLFGPYVFETHAIARLLLNISSSIVFNCSSHIAFLALYSTEK